MNRDIENSSSDLKISKFMNNNFSDNISYDISVQKNTFINILNENFKQNILSKCDESDYKDFDLTQSKNSLIKTLGNELNRTLILYKNPKRIILDTPFFTRSTISYGLIVYARNTKNWAIIQRKHSVEFLLFIRGLYRVSYLPFLLSYITEEESKTIKKCIQGGSDVFKHIYLNELNLSDGKELEYALIRMAENNHIIVDIIDKLNFSKNTLKWTWPKGRLHISNNRSDRETPFDCAKREFIEEVEINLPPPIYISDTHISENIKTLTGRIIESRYWIYIIPEEIPMFSPKNHMEVSNRMWANTEKCKILINSNYIFNEIVEIVSSKLL
jgi:ADP-ribose pyrophosphatase YjhB (NUDIX family)